MFIDKKLTLVTAAQALPGNPQPQRINPQHRVLGSMMTPPFAPELQLAYFAMGCFWGAERLFWSLPGVVTTAVGYQGGYTEYATYQQVCSGLTGHAEAVLVLFDPQIISYHELLSAFWQNHQPTQGMRQGADQGSQYRSAIYCVSDWQLQQAEASAQRYQQALNDAGKTAPITTEISLATAFYYAEDEHQQYLSKYPQGYCGLCGSGVCLPADAD